VNTPTADSEDGGTVVTGSSIPMRNGGATSDVKTTTNKDAIDDMMRNRNIFIPAKGGGM